MSVGTVGGSYYFPVETDSLTSLCTRCAVPKSVYTLSVGSMRNCSFFSAKQRPIVRQFKYFKSIGYASVGGASTNDDDQDVHGGQHLQGV